VSERAAVLKVSDLTAGYGDLKVIFDVSVSAWAGSVTAVFGANGAGKTTLLSAIAGLVSVDRGTVLFNDADITKSSVHARSARGIGLVQEGKRVFKQRTVLENLLLGGYRLKRSERSAALDLAHDRFPILRDKSAMKAGALSGGQQQMLAIAQALMPGPQVLLLDEPSAGLAPIIVNDLLQSVERLKADGVAIVLVEQMVGKALTVADHVLALQAGRVVIDSSAAHVDETRLHAAYLGG
jgi:branched-chain amino acid transport system ATP-binding protein